MGGDYAYPPSCFCGELDHTMICACKPKKNLKNILLTILHMITLSQSCWWQTNLRGYLNPRIVVYPLAYLSSCTKKIFTCLCLFCDFLALPSITHILQRNQYKRPTYQYNCFIAWQSSPIICVTLVNILKNIKF